MNVVLEVKGIDKLVRNLAKTRKNIGKKVTNGLVKAGLHLIRESQKIVPVQIANLKASAFVRKKSPTHIEIGYGGGRGKGMVLSPANKKDVPYAAWVHEIPYPPHAHGQDFNVKHAAEIQAAQGTPRGTAAGGMFMRKPEEQWKYLERPIKDNKDKILKIIRNEIIKLI